MRIEITITEFWQKYQAGERNFENISLLDPVQSGLCDKFIYRVNVTKAKLSGLKLLSLDLSEANLNQADLSGSNLQGSTLVQANLRNANLQKANLRGVNFNSANLQGANLEKAIYDRDTRFPRDFNPVTAGAYLIAPQTSLRNADLSDVDLTDANLKGADLEGANLRKTKLLGEVDLSEANLSEASLREAIMESTILVGANLQRANLQGACLNSTDFTNANLRGANLSKVWVKRWGPDFTNANLTKANLTQANLGEQTELGDAQLMWANLREIKLWRAELSGANLRGADLTNADLRESNLARAILEGAKTEGTNFYQTNLSGTIFEQPYLNQTNPAITNDSTEENKSKSLETTQNSTLNSEFPAIATDKDINSSIAVATPAKKDWLDFQFASESEMRIAQALDQSDVLFFLNCQGRISNTNDRENQEIDFLICYQGKWGILQIDNNLWNTEQAPVNYQESDRLFKSQGIKVIEYYDPQLCLKEPDIVVQDFLTILQNTQY